MVGHPAGERWRPCGAGPRVLASRDLAPRYAPPMTICRACRTGNEDGARFCSNCGSALEPGCPSCGASVAPDARFCSACGAAIASPTAPGEVLATTEPRPGEPMVTGDTVNAAARLQGVAAPGEVVASERTARAVRGFRMQDIGLMELKGKAERVHAFRVLGEAEVRVERGI